MEGTVLGVGGMRRNGRFSLSQTVSPGENGGLEGGSSCLADDPELPGILVWRESCPSGRWIWGSEAQR